MLTLQGATTTDMSGLQFDGVPMPKPAENVRTLEARDERRFQWQSALLIESVRRQTFTNWTVPFIDPDKLAEAGFFYLRTQDHVQCVFCQGIVGFWDPGDEPKVEHNKHFPNCPFVTGVATGNIPRANPDNDIGRLYTFLDDYHAFRVAGTRPQIPSSTYHLDAVRVPDSGQLAFPQFNTPSSRLQTFTRWPQEVGVSPDQLAEAGFFSTGLADWVQCFHCGGGLFGWRQGDDPVRDHARFYPFCPFIRLRAGEEAVTHSWKDNSVPTVKSRPITLSTQEAELLLHHPIAKRLVGMGLSQVSVKEALKLRLEARGAICRTVTEALELVFDYEEDQRKRNTTNSVCHDGLNIPAQVDTSQHFHTGSNVQDKHRPPPLTPDHTGLLQEVEALRQQLVVEESRLMCRLCKEEQVAVVFQPCSHLHLCAVCARPRDTCTTCGAVVRGTLRPIIG
ncbi:baculoviral IAP repeat-containing protein 7-like isoform X2 [Panulirus ornatus]|uniref:baculoviral IAP repeat-containing protein 7-like isoform X2 n=1 Tax=Panulirus ornatus TaxID=150431 RepID=UPI003A8B17FC